MSKEKKSSITRKEFLKQSAGIVATGLIGTNTSSLLGMRKIIKDNNSELRILGRTGIKVSPLCYGASRTMEPALVHAALDKGINFIDTGRSYSNGENEIMLGKALKGMRKDLVIQSKARVRISKEEEKLNTKSIRDKIFTMLTTSLNESLNALQTDYIDILLLHGIQSPDILFNEAVIEFFQNVKKSGKIRACGFSSHSNQVAVLKNANKNSFYDVFMVPYNHKGSFIHSLSGRYSEWDQPAVEKELKKAADQNCGIVAMKTCSAGSYAPDPDTKPSYTHALKCVIEHPFIHSAAVAMANFNEIEEDIQAMYE
ncbi:MAG: aldo/keto reductase [bacterium]